MYIAVILENFNQAQEDVQQVINNRNINIKINSYVILFRV